MNKRQIGQCLLTPITGHNPIKNCIGGTFAQQLFGLLLKKKNQQINEVTTL